jgi:rubrerythrin
MFRKKVLIIATILFAAITLTAANNNLMSKIPESFDKMKPEEVDQNVLRLGLIAELDAVNLYQQLAAATQNKEIKKLFLDIANEEKVHQGEFQTMLLKLDKELGKSLDQGKDEADKMMKELK